MAFACVLQCDPGVVCGAPATSFYKWDPPHQFHGSVMPVCARCGEDGMSFRPKNPVKMDPDEATVWEILES